MKTWYERNKKISLSPSPTKEGYLKEQQERKTGISWKIKIKCQACTAAFLCNEIGLYSGSFIFEVSF